MTKYKWLNNLIFVVCMTAALLFVWALAALAVDNSFALPKLSDVWTEFCVLAADGSFYTQVALTVGRAVLAFVVSLAIALVLALLANLYPIKRPVCAVVTLLRALPTMSIIFLCIVMFPSKVICLVVTFLVAFPVMYAAFDGAIASAKPLVDMCNVFGVGRLDKMRFVFLPQIAENAIGQCRSTIALAVKVCIAGEALALPRQGIGVEMYVARQSYDMAALLAWTVAAIVCCYLLDGIVGFVASAVKGIVARRDRLVDDTLSAQDQPTNNADNLGSVVQLDDVTLDKVGVQFGDRVLYKDLDFTFPAGKVCVIVGSSGCGKTTLLNVVAGLVSHSGAISGAKRCGYVFQEPRLATCSVVDNVQLVLRKSFADKELQRQYALRMLRLAELEQKSQRLAQTLSGGEQQRVSLARAFAFDCDVLLCDEPMKSLDLSVKRKLYQTFDKLLTTQPRTTLYVTHDVEEAVMLADEIYVVGGSPCNLQHVATIAESRSLRDPWSVSSVLLRKQLENILNNQTQQ